jgi:hypothetical protein
MTIQCSSLCLETAHRSIEMIYTHLDLSTVFGPVPAWWYSVLCKMFIRSLYAGENF